MSLAVDAADFGIWIRISTRNDVWASEKFRELFGFTPSEPLESRCHPETRASSTTRRLSTGVR